MSRNSAKLKICYIVVIVLISFLLTNMAYADTFGIYEVGDFSSYNRDLDFGTDIDDGDIISIDGFNTLQLSGDNEYVKTAGDLAGFTTGSDWSWMTIMQADQVENFRVFMRGKGWADLTGDFDLRVHAVDNTMDSWNPLFTQTSATDSAINDSDLVWLAGTYDYSETTYSLYVNGIKSGENNSISPMDDSSNNNPLNINGQWANNKYGVGNVYVEGSFSIAQLILTQSLISDNDLLTAYTNREYMASDSNTWFDFRVATAEAVPEPATMLLLGSGLVSLAGFRRKFKKA